MAASDSQLAAGRRLAGDLRAIRRKHDVDLKEVLDATRLADDVIEQLEEDCLVNHPAFNRVYLKSLFGAYGDAVGIKREDMRAALEEVFDGDYVGSLARSYLGRSVAEEDVDAILTATTNPGNPGIEDEVAAVVHDTTSPAEAKIVEADAEPGQNEETEPSMDDADPASEALEKEDGDEGDNEEAPDHVEGVEPENIEESQAEEERTVIRPEPAVVNAGNVWTGLADKKTVLLPNMSGTALAIISGIAFLALVWFAVTTVMNLGQDEAETVVAADTSSTVEVFRPERVILPDSMVVSIIAFTEVLDPIRITADRDLRKPYWVELMDTHRVAITDRILLEREADHTRVLVDGFAIPGQWLMQGDPVEISRERVQTWLDSLVTAGVTPVREPPAAPPAEVP